MERQIRNSFRCSEHPIRPRSCETIHGTGQKSGRFFDQNQGEIFWRNSGKAGNDSSIRCRRLRRFSLDFRSLFHVENVVWWCSTTREQWCQCLKVPNKLSYNNISYWVLITSVKGSLPMSASFYSRALWLIHFYFSAHRCTKLAHILLLNFEIAKSYQCMEFSPTWSKKFIVWQPKVCCPFNEPIVTL